MSENRTVKPSVWSIAVEEHALADKRFGRRSFLRHPVAMCRVVDSETSHGATQPQ